MDYYRLAFKKYAVFTGRARRKEYWYFVLFNFIFAIIIAIIEAVTGLREISSDKPGVLSILYSLVVLLPSLAVTVRRLHDTGRSGWWILIALIPIIGAIVLIVFLAQDSKTGSNKYGPNPKGANGTDNSEGAGSAPTTHAATATETHSQSVATTEANAPAQASEPQAQ